MCKEYKKIILDNLLKMESMLKDIKEFVKAHEDISYNDIPNLSYIEIDLANVQREVEDFESESNQDCKDIVNLDSIEIH